MKRHYGFKVGDLVKNRYSGVEGVIIHLDSLDNNRFLIKAKNKYIINCVAEQMEHKNKN